MATPTATQIILLKPLPLPKVMSQIATIATIMLLPPTPPPPKFAATKLTITAMARLTRTARLPLARQAPQTPVRPRTNPHRARMVRGKPVQVPPWNTAPAPRPALVLAVIGIQKLAIQSPKPLVMPTISIYATPKKNVKPLVYIGTTAPAMPLLVSLIGSRAIGSQAQLLRQPPAAKPSPKLEHTLMLTIAALPRESQSMRPKESPALSAKLLTPLASARPTLLALSLA